LDVGTEGKEGRSPAVKSRGRVGAEGGEESHNPLINVPNFHNCSNYIDWLNLHKPSVIILRDDPLEHLLFILAVVAC
jgi:hypothetical protein